MKQWNKFEDLMLWKKSRFAEKVDIWDGVMNWIPIPKPRYRVIGKCRPISILWMLDCVMYDGLLCVRVDELSKHATEVILKMRMSS